MFEPGELVSLGRNGDVRLMLAADGENYSLTRKRTTFKKGTLALIVSYARREWNRIVLVGNQLYVIHEDNILRLNYIEQ